MIEYGFNELDNDFITLWSSYILYHDKGQIIKPLTMLAEKGQINAIQSWYLLKEESEQNERIEKIVANYKMDNFNQMHASANRLFDKNKKAILALRREITEEVISFEEIIKEDLSLPFIYRKYNDVNLQNVRQFAINHTTQSEKELVERYRQFPYSKRIQETANFAEEALNSSGSALICERLLELYYAEPYILDNKRICQKDFIYLRKILNKKLAKNPQDIPAKFSLGKNLVFWGTDKEIKKGQQILRELADRPLSCCYDKQNGKLFFDDVK